MNESPFFVGIGAQKGGTTWLAKYFASHSQVGFSPIKELHYFDAKYHPELSGHFDQKMVKRLGKAAQKLGKSPTPRQLQMVRCRTLRVEMVADERRYVDYFNLLRTDDTVTVGEITPAYSMLNVEGFEAMKRLFPEAKALFSLRDPMARFWSHLRMHETRQGKRKFSAEEMVQESIDDPQYIVRTDYERTLKELYKVFDKEDVHVLFFEHLMDPDSHVAELGQVNDFLGIDHQPSRLDRRVNASKKIELGPETEAVIVQKFASVYETAFEMFGDRVPDAWRKNYELIDR